MLLLLASLSRSPELPPLTLSYSGTQGPAQRRSESWKESVSRTDVFVSLGPS